jgi:aminocarboxymuconate-semialdehyde decarboxylase
MKIDAYTHILPPAYAHRFNALGPMASAANLQKRISGIPELVDLDRRFKVMDEFGEYKQIISIPAPQVDEIAEPAVARELARIGNEGLAELVDRHPDRFAGFIASLPVNDPDAAVGEIDYACGKLGALGIQMFTSVKQHPMDEPRFEPIFKRMAELDRMIWVHPCRNSSWPDYPWEERSKFELWWVFGWEYDTAVFMGRIVFAGILERYPNLKMLIHHGGSMIPHFAGRIVGLDMLGSRTPAHQLQDVETYPLSLRPMDYFKKFYADTALFGAEHAVRCSTEFFGVDHMLFGTDDPYGPPNAYNLRETIANLDALDFSDAERSKIYEGNARRLFGLR